MTPPAPWLSYRKFNCSAPILCNRQRGMREVSPEDGIFSFVDTRIAAIGIAQSYCWESPKPVEFGETGQNWENVGWKVKVAFTTLLNKVRPKDHMKVLGPLLPGRYSPLQPNGNGIQSIYLTEVSATFAEVLAGRSARRRGSSPWRSRSAPPPKASRKAGRAWWMRWSTGCRVVVAGR
jgi:hypothetical protein